MPNTTTAQNLYLIERDGSYDEVHSFVVAASTPAAARRLAAQHPGDEGAQAWLDAAQSTLRLIGTASRGVKVDEVLSRKFVPA